MGTLKFGDVILNKDSSAIISNPIDEIERKMQVTSDLVADIKKSNDNHEKYLHQVSDYLAEQQNLLMEYLDNNQYNFSMLQCYVERELLIQDIENKKAQLRLEIYINSPWYHKISKKIMAEKYEEADIQAFEMFKNKLEEQNIKIKKLVDSHKKDKENKGNSQENS